MDSGIAKLKTAEANAIRAHKEGGGFWKGEGKSGQVSGKNKGKISTATAGVAIAMFLVFGLIIAIVGIPLIMIGAIDYNLQRTLGFSGTVAILEEQGEHVTAEMMAEGRVPEGYASDLAAAGIEVGQVAVTGEFFRTNVYLADVSGLEVAAVGDYLVPTAEGELAMLFRGELIRAEDFVARVESNPVLYAAYAKAADISARYYYSTEVEKQYKAMGLSRGNFNEWQATGDAETDEANFRAMLAEALDNKATVSVSGVNELGIEAEEGTLAMVDANSGLETGFIVSVDGDMGGVIGEVAEETTGDGATEKAAELLNMALSSQEPYTSASAFLAVEEAIQRARIGDEGPVNEVMNLLTEQTEVTYMDVAAGSSVTKNTSILDTPNFIAAASEASFSREEAQSFSRDRVLMSTGQANSEVVQDTTVMTSGEQKSNALVKIEFGDPADAGTLMKAKDDLELAYTRDAAELFPSAVGGNRIVAGGSFISNNLNTHVLGAMPSDAGALAEYQAEVEKVFARQAEAERATLSPFDISSPNTFLGSIVHKFATAMVKNRVAGSAVSFSSVVKSAGEVVGSAVSGLLGVPVGADGEENNFTTMAGTGCTTVNSAAGVVGDLYCTAHTSSYTGHMSYRRSDWENVFGGDAASNTGYQEFVKYAMDRETTVGVKSAAVCQQINPGIGIINMFTSWIGIYDACAGVDEAIATGAAYTLTGSNTTIQNYSGYTLYDTTRALLSGAQSSATAIREKSAEIADL